MSALYASAVEEYLKERRRRLALGRIEKLIGRTDVAPEALQELERDRRRPDRDVA